jgi:hypothetical protein
MGAAVLRIPQVRDGIYFHPVALESGCATRQPARGCPEGGREANVCAERLVAQSFQDRQRTLRPCRQFHAGECLRCQVRCAVQALAGSPTGCGLTSFSSQCARRCSHGGLLRHSRRAQAVLPAGPWQAASATSRECMPRSPKASAPSSPRPTSHRGKPAQSARPLLCPNRPKLVAWMEAGLLQGLAVYALPTAHQPRRRIRNANGRVN